MASAVTGAYLEGAEVTVGAAAPVLTDRDGSFIVYNVPAGTQNVRYTLTVKKGTTNYTVKAYDAAGNEALVSNTYTTVK